MITTPEPRIYFEAQTGLIHDRQQRLVASNYYTYTVLARHRAEIEKAISAATVEAGGLTYPVAFLRLLDEWEREARHA